MEKFKTGTDQKIWVHDKEDCISEYCCIHNPSNHHMVYWPLHWRSDRCIFERIDPEGVGHPDPDDMAYQKKLGNDISVHGCNGFCNPVNFRKYEKEKNKNSQMDIDWKEDFIYFLEQKDLLIDYISLVEYCNYHPYSKVLDNLDPNEYISKGFNWGESNYHLWEFVDTEWVDYFNYWKDEYLTI